MLTGSMDLVTASSSLSSPQDGLVYIGLRSSRYSLYFLHWFLFDPVTEEYQCQTNKGNTGVAFHNFYGKLYPAVFLDSKKKGVRFSVTFPDKNGDGPFKYPWKKARDLDAED